MLLATNLIVYFRARKARPIPIENPLEKTRLEEESLPDVAPTTGRTPNDRPQRQVLKQLDGDVSEPQRTDFALFPSPHLHRNPLLRREEGQPSRE